jgi:hypothetical protein
VNQMSGLTPIRELIAQTWQCIGESLHVMRRRSIRAARSSKGTTVQSKDDLARWFKMRTTTDYSEYRN